MKTLTLMFALVAVPSLVLAAKPVKEPKAPKEEKVFKNPCVGEFQTARKAIAVAFKTAQAEAKLLTGAEKETAMAAAAAQKEASMADAVTAKEACQAARATE